MVLPSHGFLSRPCCHRWRYGGLVLDWISCGIRIVNPKEIGKYWAGFIFFQIIKTHCWQCNCGLKFGSSTTNRTSFHEWGAALPGSLIISFIRVYLLNSWLKSAALSQSGGPRGTSAFPWRRKSRPLQSDGWRNQNESPEETTVPHSHTFCKVGKKRLERKGFYIITHFLFPNRSDLF